MAGWVSVCVLITNQSPPDACQLQSKAAKSKRLTEAMTLTHPVSLSPVKCMQNLNVTAAVWEMYRNIVVDCVIIRCQLERKVFRGSTGSDGWCQVVHVRDGGQHCCGGELKLATMAKLAIFHRKQQQQHRHLSSLIWHCDPFYWEASLSSLPGLSSAHKSLINFCITSRWERERCKRQWKPSLTLMWTVCLQREWEGFKFLTALFSL